MERRAGQLRTRRACRPTPTCSIATAATARSPTSPSASGHREGHRPLFDDGGRPRTSTATAGRTSTSRRDSTAAILYRNNHDGTFDRRRGRERRRLQRERQRASRAWAWRVGDYNGDGRLDLLKTHFADDIPALYRNLGKGLFEDVASAAGLAVENRFVEWGAGMPDLDNDGRPDLFYVTGNVYPEIERVLPQYPHRSPRARVPQRRAAAGSRTSRPPSGDAAVAHSSRGAAFGDIDNDGDIDVLVMNMNEPPSLLRNDLRSGNGWIEVALEGTRSNRSAIGATVVVTAGGRTQARTVLSQSSYYSHDDFRLHFGLGASAHGRSRSRSRWPAGGSRRLTDVEAGSRARRSRSRESARTARRPDRARSHSDSPELGLLASSSDGDIDSIGARIRRDSC